MNLNLTRIAPTPSGFLHLGNLYSFLITKALAEKTGAKILLRIDDLDRERYKSEYVQDIFDTLDFMEISYDVGPKNVKEFEQEWSQIHRMNSYLESLKDVQERKLVFGCDCTRKKIQQLDSSGYYLGLCQTRRIPLDKEGVTWRMDTLESDFIKLKTYQKSIQSHVMPQDTAFFVVRKKNRLPTYQLTSTIDDLHYGVDLIVRGTDLFGSSLAQQVVADGLGLEDFSKIIFHHHKVLKSLSNKKLSKSDGATSIQFLRKDGKKRADIFRLLGEMSGGNEPIDSYESFKSIVTI
jgi:glutamyl-tRNA synthetase